MPQLTQITETSPLLHDANCVYCHVDLELGDQAVVCDACKSPHHADCWQANSHHCATFGCDGKGAITRSARGQASQRQIGRRVVGSRVVGKRRGHGSRQRIGRRVVVNSPRQSYRLSTAAGWREMMRQFRTDTATEWRHTMRQFYTDVIIPLIMFGTVLVIMTVAFLLAIQVYAGLSADYSLSAVVGALLVMVSAILISMLATRLIGRLSQ